MPQPSRFNRRALAALLAAAHLAGISVQAAAQTSAEPDKMSKMKAPAPSIAKTETPKVAFAATEYNVLPGWAEDDHLAALKTFLVSCEKLLARTAAREPTAGKPEKPMPPADLVAACKAAIALGGKPTRVIAKAFFERHFTPHRVIHATSQGLFTGYYEPVLEGSRIKQGKFQTPIHRRPADLVNLVDESRRGAIGRSLTHARLTKAGLVPFPTRAEIDDGALNGQNLELVYLRDPVDAFFLQIQGSGRVRLPDGKMIRVQYDGKNGHPYTSVGRYMIDKGLMSAERMSLGAMTQWLRSNLERARPILQRNESYVFFREAPDGPEGPLGALEVPLTTGRSLAVDTSVHALGTPVYVSAPTLTHALPGRPFHRLMIAQDVGSAIKGPERGDIYFGTGDKAGRIAGITKHPGHFFVLLPKRAKDVASDQAKR